MYLKDVHEKCRHCINLKAWCMYMDGNHYCTCSRKLKGLESIINNGGDCDKYEPYETELQEC